MSTIERDAMDFQRFLDELDRETRLAHYESPLYKLVQRIRQRREKRAKERKRWTSNS